MGALSSSARSQESWYSRASIRAARSIETALPRVPGAPLPRWAEVARVAATPKVGTITSLSAVRMCVLAIMVWPEIRAPGPWPVWIVVTP